MNNRYILFSVIIMSVITFALRSIPFIVFGGKRETPKIVNYLGRVLPFAIMSMLVVYCLKGVSFASVSGFVPELVSVVLVAGLYVWKRNTLLSIVAGTALYMFLTQAIF